MKTYQFIIIVVILVRIMLCVTNISYRTQQIRFLTEHIMENTVYISNDIDDIKYFSEATANNTFHANLD